MMAARKPSPPADKGAKIKRISPPRTARIRRSAGALSAAVVFWSIVPAVPGYGETGQVVAAVDAVASNASRDDASTNAENLTCQELKTKLESTGSLIILSGPKGWGDTFYGPRVPQCQFWTRPVFSFVNTRDGRCGVGYICVEKFGSAGGGGM
jgi:hypothetical protein